MAPLVVLIHDFKHSVSVAPQVTGSKSDRETDIPFRSGFVIIGYLNAQCYTFTVNGGGTLGHPHVGREAVASTRVHLVLCATFTSRASNSIRIPCWCIVIYFQEIDTPKNKHNTWASS
eukprot:GHVU01059983.1.p1 GENE.GHVU01059983.1~~GHVU01059983.1.p1  ORF type:complete len:118 (+),score=4.08 GHVU01059983.1:316-669(+)